MANQKETYARILIDKQLEYSGWDITDGTQVDTEVSGNSGRADYVLYHNASPICIIEAKRPDIDPYEAEQQVRKYADESKCPFIITSNGTIHWFWDLNAANEQPPKRIERLPSREDLVQIVNKRFTPPSPLASEHVTAHYLKRYNDKISLRKYQIEALDKVAEEFDNQNKDKFLLEMATGTGKTLLCAALILRFLKSRNAQRVLFIVDRIELAKQTMEDFNVILRDYGPVIYKNARQNPLELRGSSVVVATLQSLMVNRRFREEFTPFYFDLIINDEAHRSIYGNSREAVQFFQGTRVGLTATPKNYLRNVDISALSQTNPKALEARELRDTYKFFGCESGEPTFRYDIIDAVNDPEGPFLCNPTIYDIKSDITTQALEDTGWTVTVNEQEETYKLKDLERKIFVPERNELLCRNLLANAKQEPNGEFGKSIVFCVNQNHATEVTKILNTLKPGSAVTITSRVKEASTIAKDFRDGKRKEKIAVSVDMLSTGYNCRDLLNVALFRPIFSPAEYIQIKGRGTRLFDFYHEGQSIPKETFNLLDYCGVAAYFEEEYDYNLALELPRESDQAANSDTGTGGTSGVMGDIAGDEDSEREQGEKIIPVWEGHDRIVSEESHIVGPEGEKVDVMTYRGRFEQELKEFAESAPDLLAAIEEEDDDAIEEIMNERFLFRPENYFSAEKLMKAYDVPASIAGFIYSVLGNKPLPSKRDLARDTVSSLSSLFTLNYEQERWIETTTNTVLEDRTMLTQFLEADYTLFQRPQFNQLGGIATLNRLFGTRENIENIFETLRNSTLIQQALAAGE